MIFFQLHDPLVSPGSADITADVDFNFLKRHVTSDAAALTYGPVTQKDFLLQVIVVVVEVILFYFPQINCNTKITTVGLRVMDAIVS